MAKGPLRNAIEDFLLTSPPGSWILKYREDLKARQAEIFALRDKVLPIDSFKESVWIVYYLVAGSLYVWTGWHVMYELLESTAGPTSIEQGKKSLQGLIQKTFSEPQLKEVAELIGSLITDPVMTLFEQYAGKDNEDPKNFARAFHGLMTTITTTGALADALAEASSAGAIKAVGNMVQSVYWNLGLGFLGWQTMAPILSAGLQPGLTRYYQHAYRPLRFGASELRDLYALGAITPEALKTEAAFLGWRDQDIQQWIELAFRTLATSDIWQALHEGKRDKTWTTERLRALGYDPDDIPLLFELNPPKAAPELKDTSASTLRQAYREGLISAAELRAGLKVLSYNDDEIELIVSLEDLNVQSAAKRLTVAQIKDAWAQNVIGDPEARHYLGLEDFATEQIDLLLSTWKAELAPVFRKVNGATVIGAYVEHIYNRVQAHDRLTSIGFTDQDATLELDLAELRNPEAFNPPAAPPPKLLTPGVLGELLFYGLISQSEMIARLVALNYSQADAELLSQAAVIRASPTPRPVPYGSVLNAYRTGVIDRLTAKNLLVALGYSGESAELVLATLEAQFPEDFGAPPEVRMKSLSEATLVDLTVAGILTEDELSARLLALNYAQADIDLVLSRVAQLKAPAVRVLTESTVLRAYLAGVLTREQALDRIVSLAISPEDAETLVSTFEAEHPEVFNPALVQTVRAPTIAALVAAVQKGLLTEDEYTARAQEIGYTPDDAALYLALATRNERKATTQLSTAQIISAYDHGFYSWGQSMALLATRGYSDGDAAILLRIAKDLIANTDVWYGLIHGTLSVSDALTALVNAKYADADIVAAFGSLPPATLLALGVTIQDLTAFLGQVPGGV